MPFQSPEGAEWSFFKTWQVASQHGREGGKVCLTWDPQACDRKEFEYAPSLQPPYHPPSFP